MRSMFRSARVGAFLMIAALAGCVIAPDGGAYDSRSGYGSIYGSGFYAGSTNQRYSGVYQPDRHRGSTSPRSSYRSESGDRGLKPETNRNDTRRLAGDLKDWRSGDGAFRRKQRELGGVGLGDRQRLDLQERLQQDRRDTADQARARRNAGKIVAPGSSDLGISEKFDQDVGRRMERASQAERRAQRRAAEVRRQLRAERESQSE
jgi:hypothetical protein